MKGFVPSSIKEAVDFLYATMTEEGSDVIRSTPPEANHMTGGMAMRNAWGLWGKDSQLKRDAIATYGIAHPDDISGLINAWLWARERGEEFDPVAHCQRYHEHWKACGTDSLSAGGYNSKDHAEAVGTP